MVIEKRREETETLALRRRSPVVRSTDHSMQRYKEVVALCLQKIGVTRKEAFSRPDISSYTHEKIGPTSLDADIIDQDKRSVLLGVRLWES
ncbi:unnamed protein product [Victoria cruziana]